MVSEQKNKIDLSILDNYSNVPVELAAKILDKTMPFIYIGLQNRLLPFGVAVKTGVKNYDYHISPGMLKAYITGNMCIQFNEIKEE